MIYMKVSALLIEMGYETSYCLDLEGHLWGSKSKTCTFFKKDTNHPV